MSGSNVAGGWFDEATRWARRIRARGWRGPIGGWCAACGAPDPLCHCEAQVAAFVAAATADFEAAVAHVAATVSDSSEVLSAFREQIEGELREQAASRRGSGVGLGPIPARGETVSEISRRCWDMTKGIGR